MNKHELSVLQP